MVAIATTVVMVINTVMAPVLGSVMVRNTVIVMATVMVMVMVTVVALVMMVVVVVTVVVMAAMVSSATDMALAIVVMLVDFHQTPPLTVIATRLILS